jgi:hypothetical protein
VVRAQNFAAPVLAAGSEHPVHGNEHVLSPGRAVVEHLIGREMAAADFHAGRARGHQREGDAKVLRPAEQAVRVFEAEGETHDRRDRGERDVALLPAHPHAEHLLALVVAVADDAAVGHGRRVRTGERAGQGETGDFVAARQAGQVVILLRIVAVFQQQFGRTQRIGHHHRDGGGKAPRRDLHHHRGMRQRREAEPAECLGDDHPEEALFPNEPPDLRRQVAEFVDNAPVVEHGAERLGRPVEERLFLRAQFREALRAHRRPVGRAGEQLRVPPDRAGLDRLALGVGHGRHQFPVEMQDRRADQAFSDRA